MPKLRHSRGLPIEQIAHVDLTDMPDVAGINSDHDARYYTQAQLNSTIAPSGASLIGVQDIGAFFAGADVEAILQEIAGVILPGAYLRLDGTNVPTANYNWTTNLTTIGTLQGATVTGTTSVIASTMTLATGSIKDSTGAISFDNENLITTGTISGADFRATSTTVLYQSGGAFMGNPGTLNLIMGIGAGYGLSGNNNLVIGAGAGRVMSTASGNMIMGTYAGYNLTGALQNVLIGYETGYGITTGSDYNTLIGALAGFNITSSYGYNVGIGYKAFFDVTTQYYGTATGYQSGRNITGGFGNVCLGADTGIPSAGSATGRIAIGTGAKSEANYQMVIGGPTSINAYITSAFFGSGVTDATPKNIVLNATGGSGTDIAGASMTIAGGKGTGTGVGGSVILQTSGVLTTGVTLQSLITRLTINNLGNITLGSGVAGYDQILTFDGETNDGVITWMEDEDYFDFADVIKLPYLANAPGTLANGLLWMESDGLHIYYNGTEKVVAGA